MSQLDVFREALADANMRYSITVTHEGAVLTVQGKRDENPLRASTVELQFDTDQKLVYVSGRR